MAYLGNAPARSFISFEKQVFTIVNSQTAYTLSNSVTNENDIRLVINNVEQEPGSGKAYTASGTTLTLSAALTNGTDEMYCVFLGRAVGTVNAPAGSVSTSQLAGDAVTEAKIADGAVESEHLNNNVISGQTELASSPADTDELLISDAGTLKRIDVSLVGGKNTPSFAAVVSTDTSLGTSNTLVPFDAELHDSDDCYTNTSGNYKFTPNVAGKYYIGSNMYGFGLDDQDQVFWSIYFNGNQAAYNASWSSTSQSNRAMGAFVGAVLEFDGVDDYVQIYCHSTQSSFTIDNGAYSSTSVYTKQLSASHFFGYRLIGA